MNATIYTKPSCAWCIKAKSILTAKNIPYTEYIIGQNGVTKDTVERALPQWALPVKSVPQILLNDEYIGGCTELMKKLGTA